MDRPKVIRAANDPAAYVIVDARDYDSLVGIRSRRKRKDYAHFRRGRQQIAKPTRQWQAYRSGHFYCGTLPDKVVWLHREITKCPVGKFVGFRDGDQRNCRRANLVVCPTKEEAQAWTREAVLRAAAGAQNP